jgi:hypothetical protein
VLGMQRNGLSQSRETAVDPRQNRNQASERSSFLMRASRPIIARRISGVCPKVDKLTLVQR